MREKGAIMMRNRVVLIASVVVLSLALFGCSSQTAASQSSASSGSEQASSASSASADQPSIKESAWWIDHQDSSGTYVSVAVMVENADQVNGYAMMPLTVTAKDSGGAVIDTESWDVPSVTPNDVAPYVNTFVISDEPKVVSFELSSKAGKAPENPYALADFAITNDKEQAADDGGTKWTGEIANNTGIDFPGGYWAYAMLYKGDELVAGYSSYYLDETLAAGKTTPFEVDAFDATIPEHDSYKLYVVPDTE